MLIKKTHHGRSEAASRGSVANQLGGEVAGVLVMMELAGLKGRERISKYRLDSAVVYEGK